MPKAQALSQIFSLSGALFSLVAFAALLLTSLTAHPATLVLITGSLG